MIEITPNLSIHENELEWNFLRASGPGGQRVNRAATAVQLRFDVANSPSLPPQVKKRLRRLAGRRVTDEGVLIIEAKQQRSQERNRREALERLIQLIRKAARKPPVRRKTKPTRAAKERRLRDKRRRSEKKRLRKSPDPDQY